jgi:hypothetical protein
VPIPSPSRKTQQSLEQLARYRGPMRRSFTLLAAVVLAGAIGFGFAAPVSAITAAQLRAKALSLSNLPTGWTADSPSSSSGGGAVRGCLSGVKKAAKQKGEVHVSVHYENGQLPELSELLVAGPQSQADYNLANHALGRCKHFIASAGGQSVPVTIGAMPFPQFGDATNAYGATLDVDGVNAGFDFVLVRVGSVMGVVEYGDIGQPDPTQLERLVGEAVKKIEGEPAIPPRSL